MLHFVGNSCILLQVEQKTNCITLIRFVTFCRTLYHPEIHSASQATYEEFQVNGQHFKERFPIWPFCRDIFVFANTWNKVPVGYDLPITISMNIMIFNYIKLQKLEVLQIG